MPDAARNHAPAAGARNLILIDARLSSRSPRYTVRFDGVQGGGQERGGRITCPGESTHAFGGDFGLIRSD